MSRAERTFEKSLKRAVRGEPVDAGEVVRQWKELGNAGSRLAILNLNRRGGWDAFGGWAIAAPEAREMMAGLSRYPGISEEGLRMLEALGVEPPGEDAPSRRALWIAEAATREDSGDWIRARDMFLADPDVLEGALSLMESEPSESTVKFLDSVIAQDLTEERNQRIRKTLYRLKQQGFEIQRVQQPVVVEKEWWAFADNRNPHMQYALCFRFNSSFSSYGDLYILQVKEGKEAPSISQETGIAMSPQTFKDLCGRYSEYLTSETRTDTSMHPVSPEHAYFFWRKSSGLFPEPQQAKPLDDLLRFLGAGEGTDPLAGTEGSPESAERSLLEQDYFLRWYLDPEDLGEFFDEVKNLEQGPIILVGAPLMERKRAAASAAIAGYFDERRRRLWSFWFHKAAYFLQHSDPRSAPFSLGVAATFADSAIPIAEIAVARALFERAVQVRAHLEEQKKKEDSETSLIMTPEQFARSQRQRDRG